MPCHCGIDHWLHAIFGLQGILGMMVKLESVPASPESMKKLEEFVAKFNEIIAKQRSNAVSP